MNSKTLAVVATVMALTGCATAPMAAHQGRARPELSVSSLSASCHLGFLGYSSGWTFLPDTAAAMTQSGHAAMQLKLADPASEPGVKISSFTLATTYQRKVIDQHDITASTGALSAGRLPVFLAPGAAVTYLIDLTRLPHVVSMSEHTYLAAHCKVLRYNT